MNTGDSGKTTHDANRFVAVGSTQPMGEAATMPSAIEFTRAAFVAWIDKKLSLLKDARRQNQSLDDTPGERTTAAPGVVAEPPQELLRPRQWK
jgi:hypothetical protein